jgi:subtilase family serine protease
VERARACCFAIVALLACATGRADSVGVAMTGNVHALAQPRFDRGEVPAQLVLNGMELVLRPDAARERSLAELLAAQRDGRSPQYQRWLSPQQYAARFGAPAGDLAALSSWLTSQGLQVGAPSAGGTRLPFRGSAAAVEAAFQTPIHYFEVDGARHYANLSAPRIPRDLAPLIRGVRGLHDFHPHATMHLPRGAAATARAQPPQWTDGSGQAYVGPTDFAAIYDFDPLYRAGLRGAGVTIVIAAQSDFDAAIPQSYWQAFGVSSGQTLEAMTVPSGSDPGRTGDANEDEVYLDLEIAGGLAPGATLLVVSDRDAVTAAEFAVDQDLGAVLNLSFSNCESADGATNADIAALWSQAAAEGITVVVAAGDAGDAACDAPRSFRPGTPASGGLAVNGLASPPDALAVGGTDFNPSASGNWAASNTPGTLSNALGYVPEVVWNDTCTNALTAQRYGYTSVLAFCNAATLPDAGANPYLQVAGGGGGYSSCSTQDADGGCTGGYAAPVWQSGVLGLSAATARALPDVSMLATSWLVCSYESSSVPCDPQTGRVLVAGGTSAAAPAVAAIVALLDESKATQAAPDGRQGSIAPMLYALGALEYGSNAAPLASSLAACNAGEGTNIGSHCAFHDITLGTNAMPCSVSGSLAGSCAAEGGDAYGIITANGGAAYPAGRGYDLATGLGSVDAGQVVLGLAAPNTPGGVLATAHGDAIGLIWTAVPGATSYDVYAGTAAGQEAATPVLTGITGNSTTLTGLNYGQQYYLTVAAVSSFGASPPSNEALAMTAPAPPAGVRTQAGAGSITVSWEASTGANTYTLYEGPPSSPPATPVVSAITATSYTVSGLAPGNSYAFTVAALNSAGSSPVSTAVKVTVPPGAPADLTATAGNGRVTLNWTAAAGAATYDVYMGTNSGEEAAAPVQAGVAASGVTIGGLSNGSAYYFRVAAVNAGGSSALSDETAATPSATGGGGGALGPGFLAVLLLAVALRSRACGRGS